MRVTCESDGTLIEELSFDVAIVASDETGKEGSAGIRVYGAGVGGSGSSTESNTSESRIRFCVPLRLPTHPGTTPTKNLPLTLSGIQAEESEQ